MSQTFKSHLEKFIRLTNDEFYGMLSFFDTSFAQHAGYLGPKEDAGWIGQPGNLR